MYAAATVLQKCFPVVMGRMHAYRRAALLAAVTCLLSCRRLILMDMARSCPGAQRVRAPLKRLDRLLSNPRLGQEREALYGAMMQWLVRHENPLILVDWSDLHEDCRWQLLRASIPMSGRAVTIFEMVFPESMKGSPRAEKQFLKRLHALIPKSAQPIVVSDAGFKTPWFRKLHRLGWLYVGRLRGNTKIKLGDGDWFDSRQLHEKAHTQARRIEDAQIVRGNPWPSDLVLYRKPRQGRKRVSVRKGTPSCANASLKAQRRECEPWLLVVSTGLRHLHAQQLVSIYSKRMQIEQSFRDLKCDRLGCAFRYSLTRDPKRIAILLLIHALASFVAWLAVLTLAASSQLTYGGIRSKRARLHYSRLRIAWEAIRHRDPACSAAALFAAFRHPPATCIEMLQVPS